jgi:hypothetical protein
MIIPIRGKSVQRKEKSSLLETGRGQNHPTTPPAGGWLLPAGMVPVARNGALAI